MVDIDKRIFREWREDKWKIGKGKIKMRLKRYSKVRSQMKYRWKRNKWQLKINDICMVVLG